METVPSVKYLGVTINQEINWGEHVSSVCAKANKTIGFLRRNLKISDSSIKEKAYKVYVRPVLEYSAAVWDPHHAKDKEKFEAVQKRAARFVLNNYRTTSSVSGMLDQLGWETLEERRRHARIAMLTRIQRGNAHCPGIRQKLVPLPARQRRCHSQQFTRITARTTYRLESFLPKTIRDWNNQPPDEVEATRLATTVPSASL